MKLTKPIPRPFYRLLRAFAFDPSCRRSYGNYMTLQVPFEDSLKPGPIGRYLAVVDYDSANKCYYEPIDLNDSWILANNGLDPSESDPRFHQQMVYAVASETIERFKFALGRDIHWRPNPTRKAAPFHNKLLLLPHGIQEANAFYDPETRGIVFGYFAASEKDPGSNLPGQTIFTCLAHDIIAHEMTHALVDGIRRYFMEPTNQDVAAFHEGFADIVALFQHFSFKDAVLEALRGTGGTLFRPKIDPAVKPGAGGPRITAELTSDNPLVGLANQFGDGIGLHGPLRSAIGTTPDPKALDTMQEPHDRGSILVAAVFDAFFTIFVRRTQDLWRIAGISRSDSQNVDLHPDLLARLADEASRTAGQFCTLCIRALDYCPPVDITFGDYLRALITADHDLVRDDDLGYRMALIDAFRLRGIRPQGVISYSEEALLWQPPDSPLVLRGLEQYSPDATELERRRVYEENARKLFNFARRYTKDLGIRNTKKTSVNSFHYVQRVGPDGNLESEMVAEIIERGEHNQSNAPKNGASPDVFGGVTLLFNSDGTVRYCISKSLKKEREESQATFRRELWERTAVGLYEDFQNTGVDFRAIHRGF
jgi:hypothetical protein